MRDNQPKHRQMRQQQQKLQRRKASRNGLPAVLIVCEGRETEPNYIRGLCSSLKINMAAVQIRAGGSETDAVRLVRRARTMFNGDGEFDFVFVVCDDDGTDLALARSLATRKLRRADGRSTTVNLIVSRPSFEFWLLLHFEYCARPLASAAEAVAELRRHLTNYDKSDREIFAQVADRVGDAAVNAQRLKRELTANGASDPDTDMHKLFAQLWSMRGERPE